MYQILNSVFITQLNYNTPIYRIVCSLLFHSYALMRLESTTGDTDCDTVLDTAMLQQTYIIWAIGPLGVTAFQHFDRSGCKLI